MTILDASGKEYTPERDAESWLMHAMMGWLQSEKVIRAMVEHHGSNYVNQFYTWCKRHVDANEPAELWAIRQSAFSMLSIRTVRQQIAKTVLEDQASDYERDMATWRDRLEAWLRTPEDVPAGPKPVRPAEPLRLVQVLKQLQLERERLEALLLEHASA